jgi:hypothetical protein
MNNPSVLFSLVASVMIFVSIVFVLVKNWRDRVMRYYAFYSTCAFGILFTMFLIYAFPDQLDLTQVNKITQSSTLMTYATFFVISFIFPKSEKTFPFWAVALILLPALALGIFIVTTDFTITRAYFNEGVFSRNYNLRTSGYLIYIIVGNGFLLSATVNFIRRYRQIKVMIYRLQMRYVFIGVSFAVIVANFTATVLPRFFNYSGLYTIGPSISVFFAVIALFYSIIAYNLSDITTVIHKTFVYVVISIVIALPIFGILWAYDNKLWILGEAPNYLVAVAIVIVFILISVYIQPVIDRIFKRKQYAFGAVVDDFILENEAVRDLPDIVKRTVDILHESLSLQQAFFLLLNDQSREYELYYHKGGSEQIQIEPVGINASLVRWFVRNHDILMLSRVYTDDISFAEIRDDIAAFYTNNSIQVILPIYHEKNLIGLLCLGIKETLAGYNTEEIKKLVYFSAKCNDFISAALTYQKAMKEQLIARTIDLSTHILKNALPQNLPNISTIRFGAFIQPKYKEGCDYFDFIRPGDQGVGVIATDVSGVGVNRALYSVLLRSAFQPSINLAPSTSTVMLNLNRILYNYSQGKGGRVTAFYLYFDIKTRRLMYTNAGYPSLEVFRFEKKNFDSLSTEGISLGHNLSAVYGIARTDLSHGDIGVLYSRTLIGSKNQKGDVYGLRKLRNVVMDFSTRGASNIADEIKKSFESFMGLSSPISDVLVIIFKII